MSDDESTPLLPSDEKEPEEASRKKDDVGDISFKSVGINVAPFPKIDMPQPDIIPFDPENGMKIQNWLEHFESQTENLDQAETWRKRNICRCLKGAALTHFVNDCQRLLTWGDIKSSLEEKFFDFNVPSFSDFSQMRFNNNEGILQYFQKKMEKGKQLQLNNALLIEGLTDGLNPHLRQLMQISPPKTPTEWLTLAMKLFKHQENKSFQPANNPERNRNDSLSTNQQTFNRNFTRQSNWRSNWQARPVNSTQNPQTRLSRPARPNISSVVHYQSELPPSPCRLCSKQGILNAYHWHSQCPFKNEPQRGANEAIFAANNPFASYPMQTSQSEANQEEPQP